MKSLIRYINEKLIINKKSKFVPQTNTLFEIKFDYDGYNQGINSVADFNILTDIKLQPYKNEQNRFSLNAKVLNRPQINYGYVLVTLKKLNDNNYIYYKKDHNNRLLTIIIDLTNSVVIKNTISMLKSMSSNINKKYSIKTIFEMIGIDYDDPELTDVFTKPASPTKLEYVIRPYGTELKEMTQMLNNIQ